MRSIEGFYLGRKENIIYIQTKHCNVAIWGRKELNNKLNYVKEGVLVKITFEDLFEVQYDLRSKLNKKILLTIQKEFNIKLKTKKL